MNATELKTALQYVLASDPHQPIMIWGAPGIGKSQIVAQVAQANGLTVKDMRLSQMDPPDLRGIPGEKDGMTVFYPPAELPRPGDPPCLLFLDEINAANRATAAAGMQLVLDRMLGEYKAPDGMPIWAAGNRVSDRAVANRMPSALNNRFAHFELEPDVKSMVVYALDNHWPHEIISFLQFRPNLLHNMEQAGEDGKAFPSPRSWEMVVRSKALAAPKELRMALLKACVGEGTMIEFEGFLAQFNDLPDLNQIRMDPGNAPLPATTAGKYAVSSALSNMAESHTIDGIMKYLERFREQEFVAMFIQAIQRKDKTLLRSQAVTRWLATNQLV